MSWESDRAIASHRNRGKKSNSADTQNLARKHLDATVPKELWLVGDITESGRSLVHSGPPKSKKCRFPFAVIYIWRYVKPKVGRAHLGSWSVWDCEPSLTSVPELTLLTWWSDHKPLMLQSTKIGLWKICYFLEWSRQHSDRIVFHILSALPPAWHFDLRKPGASRWTICLMWNSSRDYANSYTATGPSTPHAVSVVHGATGSVCLRRNTNKTGKMKSLKKFWCNH